jgi:hypothetical protein
MPFQSLDHLIQKISHGNHHRWEWGARLGASALTQSRWYDLSRFHRSGPANTYPGTAKAWVSCDDSAGNGTEIFGFPHGGNVTPSTKHLVNAGVLSNASGFLMLVDLQGYWPGIALNTTDLQTLSGTPTLRYSSGQGCQMFFVTTTAPTTETPSIDVRYTNQSGVGDKSLGRTVDLTAAAIQGHISHSGSAANNIGPFLPLAAGDYGVQNVASVQLSVAHGGSGVGALAIAAPLMTIPLTANNVMVDRDLVAATPSLPRIYDGACLTWLLYSTSATGAGTSYWGYLDFAWE